MYIYITNFIKVRDIILINKDGSYVTGEVLKISINKILIYETINMTTAMHLKRAGRIISIPPNFIFTGSVYNYSFDTLKSFYDMIEMDFDFETNVSKTETETEKIILSHTQKYIDMTKKQFSNFKSRFDIKTRNFEPRIQFNINSTNDGYTMYIWYISPYRDLMDVRSNIIKDLIEFYNNEEDILLISKSKKKKKKKKKDVKKPQDSLV